MSEKKLRVALVGTGNVAQVAHLPAYQNLPGVELSLWSTRIRSNAQCCRNSTG